jgi:hypothetical protein
MANNPYFEIEQVEKYLDYLSKNTADLGKTIESNFFPMLQRVFFFRAYEVRRKVEFEGRSFPFDCIDVLNRRGRILVHFSFTEAAAATLPGFALEWGSKRTSPDYPSLLIIQNRPMFPEVSKIANSRQHLISALDFEGLKTYAREGFEKHLERQSSTSAQIVQEFMERLAIELAKSKMSLAEVEWRDLERLLGTIFSGLGYHCITTPPARDGGRDLIICDISNDDVAWYNIEIKHWRDRKANARSVEYCLETALREGRRGALLLSSGGLGEAAITARTEVYRDYLRLGSEAKILTTCRHFVSRRSGIWTEELPVRRVLFDETI